MNRFLENSSVTVLDARVVTASGGGPDKTILKSPAFLRSAGYRMLCAYMHPPRDPGFALLQAKARGWGAPLLPIPDRGPWDWRVFAELLKICRREKVSIWHGHDYKSNVLGLMLRHFHQMSLVTTVHGWVKHTSRTPLYYHLDKLCLPRYDLVLCVSQDLYEECLSLAVPAAQCILLENGIDLSENSRKQTPAEAKKRLGLPADRLLVGAVGRLSDEKGFDHLVRASQRLIGQGLDLEVRILGEGDARPRLEALIGEFGLGDRVQLLGYQADLTAWYEAMDVFALSSLREGLPNVLLEAMALETPVVATRIAGVPRLVRHEENGLLVEPGSAEELAGALGRILRDADLRLRLARAGRRTVEAEFSFAVRMDKLRLLYDRILGR